MDDPTRWDELCKLSPKNMAAALRDDDEALDAALKDLDYWRRRAGELKEALRPFAKLDAQPSLADNAWTSQYVRTGDVRRARALLGMDAPAGEGGK